MNILGLSTYFHDSAACLVTEGRIVAAARKNAGAAKNMTTVSLARPFAIVYRRRA